MANQSSRGETPFSAEEHLERLGSGSILIARGLEDPNFNSTILLVCHHDEEGSYGLVLNRPSHMPLSEVFSGVMLEEHKTRRIFIGGPVQPEELQILQITSGPVDGSFQVARHVFLGGHWNDLSEILKADARKVRLFLGYSGWASGQLAQEVRLGAWEVFTVDLERLLGGAEDPWTHGLPAFREILPTMLR